MDCGSDRKKSAKCLELSGPVRERLYVSRALQIPQYLRDIEISCLSRTKEVFSKIDADPALSYELPAPGATAGVVLCHASSVFNSLKARFYPMSFKFGITHDAEYRWHNLLYGYQKHDINRFDKMVVIYAAANPHGPAFLEASLIEKFGSAMAVYLWMI